MNQSLNKLLKGFNQLCSECEEWTTGNCDICSEALCDDCADPHYDDHDIDNEENQSFVE